MRVIVIIITVLSFTVSAFAQTTGRLTGTVSGPDGVLPGATIVVKDNQTGREVTVQASGDGSFTVPQLDFGTYTVRVTSSGFKTFTTTDLKIDIGREYTLNPTLEVGGIEEVVTVQAGADIVNSSNAELSNTVSPRQVIDLPINGRNPLALVSLQPGANATSFGINGQRSTAINVTRDGINVQDNFIRTGNFVQDQPTVDDTGEFTVTTQNASVDQGGGGSSQIQLVTPRGGSEFHGAAFIYNRNSYFAANNFFNNSSDTERPFLNRNQIGGKLGGPLPFFNFGEGGPMFVKDKAFFFVAYEKLILRQQTAANTTILLGSARNGTFTYTDATGTQRTINVLSGAGLSGAIPGTAGGALSVDPVVQSRLLSGLPASGNGAIGNNGLTQISRFNVGNNRERDSLSSRVDYDINNRNSLNFVYRYVGDNVDRPDADFSFSGAPFAIQTDKTHLFTGAFRSIIGSNFTNEVRIGYTQSNPFFNQAEALDTTPFILGGAALPLGLTTPEPTFQDQGRNTRLITFRDDAVYVWGNHAIRFGGQFESQKIVSTVAGGTVPTFTFSTTGNLRTPGLAANLFPGGINATQLALANNLRYFLGGIIGAGAVAANSVTSTSGPIIGARSVQDLRYETIAGYIGDQWRVLPQLTLNFGLRYDLITPIRNPDQIFLEPFIPEGVDVVDAILNPNGIYNIVGTSIGKPGQFFKADKNNLAPQFSFAWSPQYKNNLLGSIFGDGRTTIRGGYRTSYINDEYILSTYNALSGNDGLNVTVNAEDSLANGTTTTSLNRRAQNLTGGGFPAPAFMAPPITFAQANQRDAFFNAVFAVDPNFQAPRLHEYNIGIQREIGFNTAIEIRYVGGRSNSLIRGFDFNQVKIRDNGLLADFLNAQFNLDNFGVADCTSPGCLPVGAFFDRLGPGGAFFGLGFTESFLQAGTPGDLAVNLVANADFFPNAQQLILRNPNAGVVDLLSNNGRYRYNALQAEVRRRFVNGFSFQANYTFQKTLTNVPEEDQSRFDPLLDNENPELEYSRADLDRAHAFNFNGIYELPFGKGRTFLDRGGLVDALFGGFQLSAIVQYSSGAPISIRDPRGTLNRSSGARSSRQTANSSLTADQIKDLVGIYRTPSGIFFIDPSVIAPNGTATGGNLRATAGNPAFPGQVFFNVPSGQTGTLGRAFLNGPNFLTVDLGLSKNFNFNERSRLQLRAEAFNVFNRANFRASTGTSSIDSAPGENSNIFNINNTNFGRITNTYAPRILQFAARFEF